MSDNIWTWITRTCAVIGFGWLLVTTGFDAPWGAYILLIGLFFGPDALKSSIQQVTGRSDNGK